jgi:uncharacterized protein (DUF885 family)
MRNRPTVALFLATALLGTVISGCATTAAPAASTTPTTAASSPPAAPAPAEDVPAQASSTRLTAIADAYVEAFFRLNPDWATAEGRADADHGRLPDNSVAAIAAWRAEEDAFLAQLATIDPATLPAGSRLTYNFVRELLEGSVAQRPCETELWEVSPTWTGWQSELAFLASVQPVGTSEARQAAL